MPKKRFTRPLTIILQEELFDKIQEETETAEISLSKWFRDAALFKLQSKNNGYQQDQEEK